MPASMRFSRMAAAWLGKATSTMVRSLRGSMPSFLSLTRNARSTAEPKALTPTFLPLRSCVEVKGESLSTKNVFCAKPARPS